MNCSSKHLCSHVADLCQGRWHSMEGPAQECACMQMMQQMQGEETEGEGRRNRGATLQSLRSRGCHLDW